jgi:NADPH:quinone reductase-like Zn-dependent oxidoreductase
MRAALIARQAPRGPVAPQVEYVEDWPGPDVPGPGEIGVRAIASALNHMDLWTGMGIPGVPIEYPHIGGVDGCGIVESVGVGVEETWLGRTVVHNAAVEVPARGRPTRAPDYRLIGEHSHGTHREFWCVPVANAFDIGDADPLGAAAIGLTALTAWSMMVTKGELEPGQDVLITGIGGGVAVAALGIARWRGCRVAVTSRSARKLDRAKELGAEYTILDESQDWSRGLREWTGKRGVDLVVDTIGGPMLGPAVRSLARGGAFVTAGTTAAPAGQLELNRVFWNQLRILGSTMGTNEEFQSVMELYCSGDLVPVIDSVVPAARARSAWERLESQEQMGKIILDWS